MKRYMPLKYIFGIVGIFVIIPLSLMGILLSVLGTKISFVVSFCMFLCFCPLVLPIVLVLNRDNASIIISDTVLINNINDGTLNFGWEEELNRITDVKLMDGAEVKKYYKNCRAKRALLIHFGNYNVKYISVDLFTKQQINIIIQRLKNNRHNI